MGVGVGEYMCAVQFVCEFKSVHSIACVWMSALVFCLRQGLLLSHRPGLLAYRLPAILCVPPILLKEPWDYGQFLYEFWGLELTFEAGTSPTEPFPSLALLLCRVLLGCLVWP